jgi:hypothetical protein
VQNDISKINITEAPHDSGEALQPKFDISVDLSSMVEHWRLVLIKRLCIILQGAGGVMKFNDAIQKLHLIADSKRIWDQLTIKKNFVKQYPRFLALTGKKKDKQLCLRQLPDVVDLMPTNNDRPVQMAGGGSKAEIVPRKKEPLGKVEIQIQTSTRSLEADLTYMNMHSVEGDMADKDTKCESSVSRYIIGLLS